jgi:transcriptional regulator with XRE-family HTH domain
MDQRSSFLTVFKPAVHLLHDEQGSVISSQMLGMSMAHKIDIHVGQRLRQRRWLIGMTQQKLAEMVGIKFQQIQKYETGANRVSASRLWDISEALGVPAAHFFEGVEDIDARLAAGVGEDATKVPADLLKDKEAMDLVRSYYAIPENQRRRLFELARVLSDVA